MKPLIQLLYEGYKNPRYSRTFRRYLALLYIESQCGIRPGELLMLSKDCIIKQNALGKTLYQLEYKATKGVRGKGYKVFRTLANERVESVVDFLKKMVKNDEPLGKGLVVKGLNNSLKHIIDLNKFDFTENELNQ